MRRTKVVRVPIRVCEICAWALAKRCLSCGVEHLNEGVLRQNFYSERHYKNWAAQRTANAFSPSSLAGDVSLAVAEEENQDQAKASGPDTEEPRAKPLIKNPMIENPKSAEVECCDPKSPGARLCECPALVFGDASINGQNLLPDECAAQWENGARSSSVETDLPVYLSETSDRLSELENSLWDLPRAKEQLSALKQLHRKLQEQLEKGPSSLNKSL